jgi:hypothetical protein
MLEPVVDCIFESQISYDRLYTSGAIGRDEVPNIDYIINDQTVVVIWL